VGTVASLSAVVGEHGWTTDAVLLVVAGTGLTFGMWWVYFVVPAADLLHVRREASFVFGYVHMAVIGAIVATGAGLHTAAYYVEGHSELGEVGTVFAVAIPVGVFIGLVYVVYALLVRTTEAFHLLLLALTAVVLVALAMLGVSMAVCLLVVTIAPVVTVVGFEMRGHREAAEALAARLANPS
jgi:low temperature requirement protein LtrA